MSEKDALLALRDKIDALDVQIMESISQRANFAQQVAHVKKSLGDCFFNFDRPNLSEVTNEHNMAASKIFGPLWQHFFAELRQL